MFLLQTTWGVGNDRTFAHRDVALGLLDAAERRCKGDLVLQMQIINNRLYYLVETGQIESHEQRITKDYRQLIRLQERIEPDDSRWLANVIDTIYWTRWNLYGADSAQERREIMRHLQRAIDRSENSEQKSRLKQHLEAVRQGRRRQDWSTIWARNPSPEGKAST